ncbi:TPA: hypothetical protein ACH3X2_009526 [Trebouxia sp. C0005]
MAIGRVVPWANWEQWSAVYRGLFADDAAQKSVALEQLSVWRCRGKVPLAVDVTACLTEINIRDQHSHVSTTASDEVLRLEYSMAIVRMVNGISDKAQKGKTATSVSSNAAAAGLPRLLVDVRHEASHNDMPSLSLLRLAAAQALDWLQAAYWQRQETHLLQQQHKVVELLKDYVAAKIHGTSFSQLIPSSAHQQRSADSPNGSSTPGSSRQQAESTRAKNLHEQQAVLNQLKEVPVKGMHAFLLVGPFLDHGVMDGQILTSSAIMRLDATQPFSHGIIQPLAALWPSLPALLLAGAVQRLCQMTQPAQGAPKQHVAAILDGWVQVLLTLSTEIGQQQTQTHTRGSKRKSMSSEVQAATASELSGHMPTAAQLRALIGECLAALPKAELETATALRQVLLLLTGQVKQNHAAEYMAWGRTAEQLTALCQPETQADLSVHHVAATSTLTASEGVLDDAHMLEAEHRQQHTLQELLATDNAAASKPRGWEKVDDWTPCAIGTQPSITDYNGCVPSFKAAQLAPADLAVSQAASKTHPSPMAFAMRSAIPNHSADHPVQPASVLAAVPQQVAWSAGLLDEPQEHQLQSDTAVYDDYWQRFQDVEDAAEISAATSLARSIVPDRLVKVL